MGSSKTNTVSVIRQFRLNEKIPVVITAQRWTDPAVSHIPFLFFHSSADRSQRKSPEICSGSEFRNVRSISIKRVRDPGCVSDWFLLGMKSILFLGGGPGGGGNNWHLDGDGAGKSLPL